MAATEQTELIEDCVVGDTCALDVRLEDRNTGAAFDLTGVTVVAEWRRASDGVLLHRKDNASLGGVTVFSPATAGMLRAKLTPAETAAYPSRVKFHLRATDATSDRYSTAFALLIFKPNPALP